MDRRTTLARLLGQKSTDTAVKSTASLNAALVSGLAPYTGPFGFEQAAHLLRRATFGATYQQIKEVAANGLDTAFLQLFKENPLPTAPINPNFAEDPCTPIGETWVQAPYVGSINGLRASRDQSLRWWTLDLIRNEGLNLREKMVLFWHNHFPTADINDTRSVYLYSQLLREHALGNFRELTKQMTLNPAMLRYLNGNENTAASPNENFARELLELFTIGKGPVAGPSDYTNYTEHDVVEMAKVLTGWRDTVTPVATQNAPCPVQTVAATFFPNRHNATTKQLSHRFNDVQIPNMGDQEYAHLIDIIFSKDECARFISRKLYRWFVYYEITQQVEDEVIVPMAQIILDNDYEIRPALEALMRSEHFFDILNVGPMIKNPIDFVMSLFKTFDINTADATTEQQYLVYQQLYRARINPMQMPYYDPPSVAGWKAYYQEPVYYRHWINSVTLPIRQQYTDRMVNAGIVVVDAAGQTYNKTIIDVFKFVATLDNPQVADSLIDELVSILYPQPITPFQHDTLKGILLGTQTDGFWTTLYTNYLNDPSNTTFSANVNNRLKNLLKAMMKMPEFYLS